MQAVRGIANAAILPSVAAEQIGKMNPTGTILQRRGSANGQVPELPNARSQRQISFKTNRHSGLNAIAKIDLLPDLRELKIGAGTKLTTLAPPVNSLAEPLPWRIAIILTKNPHPAAVATDRHVPIKTIGKTVQQIAAVPKARWQTTSITNQSIHRLVCPHPAQNRSFSPINTKI
jgi:hypothetical protein